MWNWAMRVGYADTSPFKRGSEPVVKLSQEPSRSRRLHADEEAPLLAACGSSLRPVVECALETGMRRGEILSLQWEQVVGMTIDTTKPTPVITWAPRAEIVLTAAKTKTKRDRRIPISTRLRAILEMRRFDPTGEPFAADTFVFGNVLGQQVHNIKRAWNHTVLKAHGHTPTYTTTENLTPESRAALADINLHLHDLRREAGSRWLEGGVPLHTVRDWLGHTNIAQTSTYLAGTQQTQHDAMTAYEARLAAVQRRATKAKTGGRKSPSGAKRAERKPNETGPDYQRPIM
jgi:integrase